MERGALGVALVGALFVGGEQTSPSCDRPSGLPGNAFEVQRAFTGRFEDVRQPDGSTIRQPIYEPVPPGTVYNAPIIDVAAGQSYPPLDQEPALSQRRQVGPDGKLQAGTYYTIWHVTARPACQLVSDPKAFVPEAVRIAGGLPQAGLTPGPVVPPSPSPSPSPSPTAQPTVEPSRPAPTTPPPTALPTPTPIVKDFPEECPDCFDWATFAWLVVGALFLGGVLENRFSRQYRGASR